MDALQITGTSSAAAMLPPEVLSQIFLEVDPHTLYTSVRALSRSWKQCVEERLLAREFETGRWRVGLRVVRKPKVGSPWRGGRVGGKGLEAPGALWNEVRARTEEGVTSSVAEVTSEEEVESRKHRAVEQAQQAYRQAILSRYGALEDELAPLDTQETQIVHTEPIVHVIPLKYKRYDGVSTTLQFATSENELHALFENGNSSADPSRLDLDFGIVWRFPGDGQDDEQWGETDPENGWLSRFYCSTFDVDGNQNDDDHAACQLLSTPLARRVRRAVRYPAGQEEEDNEEDDEDEEEETMMRRRSPFSSKPMEWSDGGHEYASLSLSLGTEFFVRRSARANQLTRRLEVAAAAAQNRQMEKRRRLMRSTASTPRRSPGQANTPLSGDDISSLRRQLSATASSSLLPSGMSTPSPAAWKNGGQSYAFIASTPPSGSSSRRSSSSSPGHQKGPRVLRAVPMSSTNSSNGKVAPLPSVNASGYASVQHQTLVDGKEEEEASFDVSSASMTRSSSSSSTKGYASNMAISSHHSVPRAHFSAKLVRMPLYVRSPKGWSESQSSQSRSVSEADNAGLTTAVWEWCR